jgi:hypothetical protein
MPSGRHTHPKPTCVTAYVTQDASDSDGLEERWPREGDRLFVEVSWAYDAHLVRDPKERCEWIPNLTSIRSEPMESLSQPVLSQDCELRRCRLGHDEPYSRQQKEGGRCE